MTMPFVKVHLHLVWTTKNRIPFLSTPELRQKVWTHIRENSREKGLFVDFVNGYDDHCHVLLSLGADQTIEKSIQLIKGECAYWINKNQLCEERFSWQREYWAASVSESALPNVRNYIKNQEAHHRKKNFQMELDWFIQEYGFQQSE